MRSTAKSHIGYLLSHYPSANHTYLLREVRALRAAGIAVTVVAVEGDKRPSSTLTSEESEERGTTSVVKRAGLGGITAAHAATLVARPTRYIAGLVAAIGLAGWDLKRILYHIAYFGQAVVAGRHLWRAGCVHVHTHYATTVAVIAARVFPFELSASVHGSAEFIEPRAQRLREKIAACTFVRAISMYGRSQLMLASPPEDWDKLTVVRLGVDPGAFPPVRRRRERGGAFEVVTIGQLQPAKGFHVLIDALALLVADGHDIALTIVGDGAERASLQNRAVHRGVAHRVRFTGTLNQNEVRSALAESDAFALPSFAEGIPVVLMEAMASGLPCVASRITGIPELIEDGVSGLLVTPSDEVDLARGLAALDDDDELRTRLGTTARACVSREYNLARNTAQLVDLFRARLPAVDPDAEAPPLSLRGA